MTVPGSGHSDEMLRLAADACRTSWRPATTPPSARTCRPGSTVAVVGDGAVGLSGVLAAKRLGAERIIALSRHADRQAARDASSAPPTSSSERGEEAIEAVMELTDGVGVDATLECVGTGQAMRDGARRSRGRARWSATSACRTASSCRSARCSSATRASAAARAPARAYIPELLDDVLEGRINPGRVLDYETDLDGIADAYAAMDERRAIKSLVRVGSV